MAKISRFGVSIDTALLKAFDQLISRKGYTNRSEAIRDLIRDRLVEDERQEGNQDTGGAIRGAGRADIFWGSGPYAEVAAGHLKHDGDLYVLVKKP